MTFSNNEFDKNFFCRLEKIWEECRVEIRQRVIQRDQYFSRMYVAIGGVLAAAVYKDLSILYILIPWIGIYFCNLILHSYNIHLAFTHYLENDIEKKIKYLLHKKHEKSLSQNDNIYSYEEIEEMFSNKKLTGTRRFLFKPIPYILSIISIIFFVSHKCEIPQIYFIIFNQWCLINK